MTSTPPVDVSFVIVNYKTRGPLEECLRSIYKNIRGASFETIVVDNGSHDGSAEMVRAVFAEVRLICYDQNKFITPANNHGIRISRGKYVMILNPDVVFFENSFEKLFEYLERHPEVAAVGPRLVDANGLVEHCCCRERTFELFLYNFTLLGKIFRKTVARINRDALILDWNRDSTREVDILVDISMLARREALIEVGLYDEAFKLYFAEDDLCKRLRAQGWKVVFLGDAQNLHYRHQSVNQEPEAAIIRISRQDALVYSAKYFGTARTKLLRALMSLTAVLHWGRQFFTRIS